MNFHSVGNFAVGPPAKVLIPKGSRSGTG